ncbi:cohesin subunit SA-1 [Chrysoperla carnea]|uniref:cohesin subunit SA-1 n=1 Tax=Chrysoperla carnea TaxID=189513 RepID=UPI001D097759|nr:cohesin subunit SA-1 [Chrysoperla carnea]
MHRRGGKRICMEEPPIEYDNSDDNYNAGYGNTYISTNEMYGETGNENASDNTTDNLMSYEPPPTPGGHVPRITRARLRGVQQSQARDRAPLSERRIVEQPPATPAPAETRRKKTGRKPNPDINAEDENSLYFIIRNCKGSIPNICDDWIEGYKTNRETALIQLMQFFINASGCKGRITPQMQATMEHVSIIRKMTEEFDEESGEYPLIMTGQQWKKFRQNFCDFVQTLVKQCQYSIIYDQFLMDNIISLLTGLSDSQVRAFRHTATLAAMKLMTALVDVALTVSVNQDNTLRQYEAERQKARDKRGASDRLEALMTKRQELEENIDEIKNMLTYMFKSVFVHRYRDTLPEIRAISMTEIGIWMQKFHTNFLDDSYLKYIGWTLHDKVGDVRLRCLLALQPLYASEELKGKLELFTNKFKDRIVAMTLDKEYDVAVQAVRLVISIHKHHNDILSDKDCEHVYELVYSSHRQVAQAAGEFLNERLFQPTGVDPGKSGRGKRRLPNTPFIIDLVQFFIESELHEHGAYLVDSLIESNPMMKDWECMTDLLLEEPGPHEESLDNRQETSLIDIMVCCVRQAATGEAPVGRGPNRKVTSMKEQKQTNDDKHRLTEHFIQTLPQLLNKYKADHEKLTNLLTIPQYFDLEIYTKNRQENSLQQLLETLKEIVKIHQETEVLETCAKSLEYLCTEGQAIFRPCDIARSTIIDMIVNRCKETLDDYKNLLAANDNPTEDEIFDIVAALKKVSVFYSSHNLNKWNLWPDLFAELTNLSEIGLPVEAIKYCISSCFYAIMWGLTQVESVLETGGSANEEIDELKERLHNFMNTSLIIMHQSTEQILKEEAYISICDLLVVFSDQLVSARHSQMSVLVYEPQLHMQSILNEFVQIYVFIQEADDEHDERRIEELHKRRNFLAAYCKLIVYNIMPTKAAADIFKHYVKYYNDYGDIIKTTLGKAREINKTNCALTMCLSLTTMFTALQQQNPKVNTHEDFTALKELAKRFALSFGLDAVKNREAIASLHRAGILFAVKNTERLDDPTSPPPHLAFLEILTEFTNKLLKQDKRVVLNFLDRRLQAGMPSSKGEDWQPLLQYRNSLVHGETESVPVTSKRAYGRKKRDMGPADEVDHNEDEDMGSDQD